MSGADTPVIAGRDPCAVTVEKGVTYWWCACGRSKTQPFCDGSHAGTSFQPVAYVARRTQVVWFCTCKHTRHAPECDGRHNRLPKAAATGPT